MPALMTELRSVVDRLTPLLYCDKATIEYAVERNVSGRICREWVPAHEECDIMQKTIDMPCQFLHTRSGDVDIFNRGRFEDVNRTTINVPAVVDFPLDLPWLTESMRITHEGMRWRISGINRDVRIITRVFLEEFVE